MATNNNHEMTASGSASPHDEDMHGDGAEPTMQEQPELDMELLRAEKTIFRVLSYQRQLGWRQQGTE